MTHPFRTSITDARLAEQLKDQVELGHFFVFVKDGRALRKGGKTGRLFGYRAAMGRSVIALTDRPVELSGVTITPNEKNLVPLACLVSDRDLYRAEQDTVRLFIALPNAPVGTRLEVSQNGSVLVTRPIAPGAAMCIEPLAMLLAGRYEAVLIAEKGPLAPPIAFTVAEYSLAPLAARLMGHQLLRAQHQLRFDLAVTGYQVDYERAVSVALVDGDREIDRTTIEPATPGRFAGQLRISGEGPFRLRVAAVEDPSRVAEVVIAGSRRAERELTKISELGKEIELSLLPEPNALAIRGAYLTEGDELGTPLSIDAPIAETGLIRVRTDIEAATLLVVDLASGKMETREIGEVARGGTISVPLPGPTCMVFAGCFIDGHPFEAFTTFFKPQKLAPQIEVPREVRPDRNIEVRVTCPKDQGRVSCLVAIRDERLTQTDTPEVALSAAAKRNIEQLTAMLDDGESFIPIEEALRPRRHIEQQIAQNRRISLMQLYVVTNTGDMYKVEKETFMIGRARNCDLVINSSRVSRQHAAISVSNGQYYLEDLGSSNGVWRGGEKVERRHIQDGDEVSIGDEILKMIYRGHSESSTFGNPAFEESTPVDHALNITGSSAMDMDLHDELELSPPVAARRHNSIRASVREAATGSEITGRYSIPSLSEMLGAERGAEPRHELWLADQSAAEPAPPQYAPGQSGPPASRSSSIANAPEAPETRATFPELLFFGIVDVDGEAAIDVVLGGSLTSYSVEVFAFKGGDWAAAKTTFDVDQPVRADLDLPPAVHPEDRVLGKLRAKASGGKLRARVTLEGAPVPLLRANGQAIEGEELLNSPIELHLSVRPGRFVAEVEDVISGELDRVEIDVGVPGRFKSHLSRLHLAQRGAQLTLDQLEAISMRVLPSLEQPFRVLVDATASYQHLCCEQTGAKILAAAVKYLSAHQASELGERARAEEMLIAGIAHERTLWRRGRGFALYAGGRGEVSDHYSPIVVRYLWRLEPLFEVKELSSSLRSALKEAIEMADDVARRFAVSRVPARIVTEEDAYLVARAKKSSRHAEVAAFLEERRSLFSERPLGDAVSRRWKRAYVAAAWLALGELERGVGSANFTTQEMNAAGRLYSTLDSVAAIALFGELARSGISAGSGTVRVNGREMKTAEAVALKETIESIDVLDGVAMVEVTTIHVEDWSKMTADLQARVGFRDTAGRNMNRFRAGDRTEMSVSLPKGYRAGDLLHVCLPASMSWVHGGGRVKRFSVDFEGKSEVRVPLVVTAAIQGREHFAVCVRNMFEEERVAHPGLLAVQGA
jgi:hypothetical protein